jgi:acyl-lipid (8-3)-desaturase
VFAPDTAGFYATLSKRVRAHFERTGQDPKAAWAGAWRMVLQMAIGLTGYAVSLGVIGPELPFAARLVAAAVFGVFQVMPLLHAMHDASHTAIGRSEASWKFFGRATMDWYAGSCMISWHHQHIVGHHVYTNVFMADPDIPYR